MNFINNNKMITKFQEKLIIDILYNSGKLRIIKHNKGYYIHKVIFGNEEIIIRSDTSKAIRNFLRDKFNI